MLRRLSNTLLAIGVLFSNTALSIDLNNLGENGYNVLPVQHDNLGTGIQSIGDFNGDGIDDFALSAPAYDLPSPSSGRLFIVYGKTNNADVELQNFPSAQGTYVQSSFWEITPSFAGGGDINDDGFDDILMFMQIPSAPENASLVEGSFDSTAFVVFGSASNASVSIGEDSVGSSRGFQIEGEMGFSLDILNDSNGDGFSDLLISSPNTTISGSWPGAAYVIFGSASPNDVLLANIPMSSDGYVVYLDTMDFGGGFASHVAAVGDINGDGLTDFSTVGDISTWGNFDDAAFVIYGQSGHDDIDVGGLSIAEGFSISTPQFVSGFALFPRGVGDVNGDGFADIGLADPSWNPNGWPDAPGAVNIVFGSSDLTDVDLATIEADESGFIVEGNFSPDNQIGYNLSPAGDINGDGFGDLLFTNTSSGPPQDDYLVFGKADFGGIQVGQLETEGSGEFISGFLGPTNMNIQAIAGNVDANNNGIPDFVSSGSLFSNQTFPSVVALNPFSVPLNATYYNQLPAGDAPPAYLPDARISIDFIDGVIPIRGITTPTTEQQVTLYRDNSAISGITTGLVANVAWEVQTNRVDWTTVELGFNYVNAEVYGLNEAIMEVMHSDNAAGPWIPVTTTTNAGQQISSVDVSELGWFILVDTDAIFADGLE